MARGIATNRKLTRCCLLGLADSAAAAQILTGPAEFAAAAVVAAVAAAAAAAADRKTRNPSGFAVVVAAAAAAEAVQILTNPACPAAVRRQTDHRPTAGSGPGSARLTSRRASWRVSDRQKGCCPALAAGCWRRHCQTHSHLGRAGWSGLRRQRRWSVHRMGLTCCSKSPCLRREENQQLWRQREQLSKQGQWLRLRRSCQLRELALWWWMQTRRVRQVLGAAWSSCHCREKETLSADKENSSLRRKKKRVRKKWGKECRIQF